MRTLAVLIICAVLSVASLTACGGNKSAAPVWQTVATWSGYIDPDPSAFDSASPVYNVDTNGHLRVTFTCDNATKSEVAITQTDIVDEWFLTQGSRVIDSEPGGYELNPLLVSSGNWSLTVEELR